MNRSDFLRTLLAIPAGLLAHGDPLRDAVWRAGKQVRDQLDALGFRAANSDIGSVTSGGVEIWRKDA